MSMQASDCSTKGVLGETWAASILLECCGVLCTRAKHNQAYLFAFTQGLYLKQNWPKNKHLIFGCMCSMASQIICNCVNSILFTCCRRLNLVVELLEYCFYLKVSLLVNERKKEWVFNDLKAACTQKMADQNMCRLCALHSDKVRCSNQWECLLYWHYIFNFKILYHHLIVHFSSLGLFGKLTILEDLVLFFRQLHNISEKQGQCSCIPLQKKNP